MSGVRDLLEGTVFHNLDPFTSLPPLRSPPVEPLTLLDSWKGTEDMDHFLIPRLVELKAKLDKRQSGAPEEDEDEGNDTSDDASALDGKNSTAGSKSEEGGVGGFIQ